MIRIRGNSRTPALATTELTAKRVLDLQRVLKRVSSEILPVSSQQMICIFFLIGERSSEWFCVHTIQFYRVYIVRNDVNTSVSEFHSTSHLDISCGYSKNNVYRVS